MPNRAASSPRSRPPWPVRNRRRWSPSPAPTARPARSNSSVSSGRSPASRPPAWGRSASSHPGLSRGRASPRPTRWRSPATWRGSPRRASSTRRSRRPRTGCTSSAWTGCASAPAPSPISPATTWTITAPMACYRRAKLRLFAELLPQGAPAFASTALDATTMRELTEIARTAAAASVQRRHRRYRHPPPSRRAADRWAVAGDRGQRDSAAA